MKIKLVHVVTAPVTLKYLLLDQMLYMMEKGLQVAAVSSPGPILEELAYHEGMEAHGVPMSRSISPLADFVAMWRLFRLFRRIKPTIVHGSTAKAAALAMAAGALARVPVRFYTVRGLMTETRSGGSRHLLKAVERFTCFLSHRVFPVSRSVEKALVEQYLCSPRKMRLIGHGSSNGVDAQWRFNPSRVSKRERETLLGKLGIPDNAFVIGFVGRIVKDKGVEELVQAWSNIRDRYNCFLIVIGQPEAQDPVSFEALEVLRIDPRIITVPAAENSQMHSYYDIMNLLVLPTYREGFPNVVIEAAAMLVPTVATTVTGCVDAVKDRETGILVRPRDWRALAEAIERYLGDRELLLEHGRAARKRVLRDFQQPAVWDVLYREYIRQAHNKGLTDQSLDEEEPAKFPRQVN